MGVCIIVKFILEKKVMKSIIMLFFVLLNVTCSSNYKAILGGLTKNHVLFYDEMGSEYYLEHYQVNEIEYKKNLAEYRNALHKFYKSETGIITFLLQYENETETVCEWFNMTNPFSATLTKKDFITTSKGALILIDNYLLSKEQEKIIIPDYYEELSYDKFYEFYNKNKYLSKEELKSAYINRGNK